MSAPYSREFLSSRGITYRFEGVADAVGEQADEWQEAPAVPVQPARHDLDAHAAAVARLRECEYDLGERLEGSGEVGAYCGCEDCQVREVLEAAWPHLRALAIQMELAEGGGTP